MKAKFDNVEFGNFAKLLELIEDIAYQRNIGMQECGKEKLVG